MARKSHIRWIVLTGLIAVGLSVLAFLFLPRPIAVQGAAAISGPIAETVQDQGAARVRQAFVVSSPAAGRVERAPVEAGDPVIAGRTVVALLRPAPSAFLDPRGRAQAEAAIAAARAGLTAAEADRSRLNAEAIRAGNELRRQEALAEKEVATRQALENARAAADAAGQAVRAADAEIAARRAQLVSAEAAITGPAAGASDRIAVTSPASGVVTRLLQQSERSVAAGTPLVEIGESRGLEAAIEFLSQDAVRIREGMEAEIYDWGGPGVISARVRRVEPQGFTKISALGVEEQRVLVILQFTGPPQVWGKLGPGYRVWGRVYLRREPAVVKVPLGALVRADGRWAVYRVTSGRARLTPVDVGAMTDREAEIRSGLKSGEPVVLFPSDQIRDGAPVRVR